MTPVAPDAPTPRAARVVAVIDIGSNSVLLLTAAIDGAGRARALDEAGVTTRLGAGLRPGERLDTAARARTLAAVVALAARARARGATAVWAFGTSAARDATDGAAFGRDVAAAGGVEFAVLTSDEEARLAFAAVAHGLGVGERPLLAVDAGGRSTEVTYGVGTRIHDAVSLPLGALALTEAHLHADPPAPAEFDRLVAAVDDVVRPRVRFPVPAGVVLAASGGTATALAALDLGLATYVPARVHGYRLPLSALATQRARLVTMPLAARTALPGLDPGRAAILPAGAVILECLAEAVGVDTIMVSDHGVRHAVLRARLAGLGVDADLGTLWR